MAEYLSDFHLHTTHSMDGHQSVMALCARAEALGLSEICLTEHIDLGHPDPGVDAPPHFADWFADIEAARLRYPKLKVRAGIENGDNPVCRPRIAAMLDAQKLDYRLLSLHLVDNVDPYNPVYFEGKTQAEAYLRYMECRLESAQANDDYDGFAHLGYVCKFAPYARDIRPLCYHHAPEHFDALLSCLAQKGKALEVNASGLMDTDSPIPGADIIKRFLELKGEFLIFGSDAHYTERVYLHVAQAKALARSCGAKWHVTFENRKMQVHPL